MKRLLLIVGLLLSLAIVAQAQDVELVPFTEESFGVQGLVPNGWESRGFGSYARGESANDITAIFIQAAPINAETLLTALKGQLGVDEIPDATSQIEGALLWDVRRIDTTMQGLDLSVSVAISEVDGTTYLVLLQSLAEEHDSLLETVFVPVVESVAPIVEAESTEEVPVPYLVEEVTFSNGDVVLSGTLTIPEGEGTFPAVVLISGSGASDRDELTVPIAQIKPFRDIADYLTRNGIAVLRYDDRGVGESGGDAASATLEDLANDASAAVDFLAEREEFSAVGLAGHSEGGIIAPFVANMNESVAFVIGLGAPAVRMDALLLQQNRRIYAAMGVSEEDIEAIVAAQQAAFDAGGDEEALRLSVSNLIDLQLAIMPEEQREATLAQVSLDNLVDMGIAQYGAMHSMGYFAWDVAAIWSEVEQPILAIYGELDVQVDSVQNAPALEEATAGNEDVTITVFPTMNHILQEAETGAVQEYATLEQSVREDVLEAMRDWILERF